VILNSLSARLLKNEILSGSIKNNTRDAAKIKFDEIYQEEKIKMLNQHFDLYKKLDSSPELNAYVNERLFDFVHKRMKNKQ